MEDRETARMRKYGESKATRIMMATVPHVTSRLGLRKFQADGFLLTRVYMVCLRVVRKQSCEADRSFRPSKEVENARSCTSTCRSLVPTYPCTYDPPTIQQLAKSLYLIPPSLFVFLKTLDSRGYTAPREWPANE